MRTTWNIDECVLDEVKSYAKTRSIPAGQAATELIQKGLQARVPTKWENGLLIFAPGPETEVVTLEQALAFEDALEEEVD